MSRFSLLFSAENFGEDRATVLPTPDDSTASWLDVSNVPLRLARVARTIRFAFLHARMDKTRTLYIILHVRYRQTTVIKRPIFWTKRRGYCTAKTTTIRTRAMTICVSSTNNGNESPTYGRYNYYVNDN